ncbi:MAG TPA: hypothetical protein VL400_02070 [Polyangiaceae bacterium]|nr:hypothetical protein [Polyangiaceae bacterium]
MRRRHVSLPLLASPALALAFVAACADPRPVAVEVTPGKEEGSLVADPAVAEVTIDLYDGDGTTKLSSATAKPGGEFDLGEIPDTSIVNFDLTGKDAAGNVIARGRSISMDLGGVESGTVPLFIQRLGGFARPNGDLVRGHIHAPAAVYAEEMLVATGGERAIGANGDADPAIGDFFDMLDFTPQETMGQFPRAARSLVVRDTALLLIDDEGATFADLSTGETSEAVAPDDAAFGDVSGGRTIEAGSDISFIVGATRPDVPTKSIIEVDASSALTGYALGTARAGAASAYVPGVGVVVAGGSATGPGVEYIAEDLSVKSLAYAADATTGAAMVLIGEHQVALIGGRDGDGNPAPTRVLDLQCVGAEDCVAETVAAANVPEIASHGVAFAMTDAVLAIGDDEDGETLAFRVSFNEGTVTSLPLRDPRRGATAVAAPNGTLAILGGEKTVGGAATSVELYFPE